MGVVVTPKVMAGENAVVATGNELKIDVEVSDIGVHKRAVDVKVATSDEALVDGGTALRIEVSVCMDDTSIFVGNCCCHCC